MADPFPPCPKSFNLAAYVLSAGALRLDKPALEILGQTAQAWNYGELISAVRGVATGLLCAGLAPNDRVLLRLGNSADFPIAYLGIIAAGMVAVPTSPALTQSEIDKISQALTPKAVIQDFDLSAPDDGLAKTISLSDLRAMYALPAAPFQMGDPERVAYIVFTSGTSGSPRAVQHAHRAIWARKMMHRDWYDIDPSDRLLHAGTFNWTFTLGTGLMDPWSVGATALIPEDGTRPENLFDLLAAHNATIFAAAPGVFRKALRGNNPDMPALRHALSAGEKMSPSLHAEWHKATGLNVHEAFGMSECSTFISSSPARQTASNTLGYPQNGRKVSLRTDTGEAAIHDIGTIAIHRSDPGLMLGYLNAEEETAAKFQGDWFMTGDLGRMDDTGAIHYEGRADDMMNAGGFRVSPTEVETVFQNAEGIIQCAAVAFTLKPYVQVIALCYTADLDVRKNTLEALATKELARYKQPRVFHQCDTLPTSANGKLLRRVLRSQIEAQYGQT